MSVLISLCANLYTNEPTRPKKQVQVGGLTREVYWRNVPQDVLVYVELPTLNMWGHYGSLFVILLLHKPRVTVKP